MGGRPKIASSIEKLVNFDPRLTGSLAEDSEEEDYDEDETELLEMSFRGFTCACPRRDSLVILEGNEGIPL